MSQDSNSDSGPKGRFSGKPNIPGAAPGNVPPIPVPPATGNRLDPPQNTGNTPLSSPTNPVSQQPAAQQAVGNQTTRGALDRFGQTPVVLPGSNAPPQGNQNPPYIPYPNRQAPLSGNSVRTNAAPSRVGAGLLALLAVVAIVFITKNIVLGRSSMSGSAIADRAVPSTVLIYTEFSVPVTGNVVVLDTDKFNNLIGEMQRNGEVGLDDSETEALTKVLNSVLSDPEKYFVSGNTERSDTAKITVTGSGFVATADGYIITNAHVVEPDPDELKTELIKTERKWVAADFERIDSTVQRLLPGKSIGDEAKAKLTNTLIRVIVANTRMGTIDKTVSAVISHLGSEPNGKPVTKICDIKAVGKPTPGKDVAVLKIPGNNLASLPLAQNISAGALRKGDGLHVVGYPGTATFNSAFSPDSVTESSMTSGTVSAIRSMKDGWQVIQTDAPAAPGNSGGPVLDDHGEVVGILTFSSVDPVTGQPVQGFNFAMPVDIIREFLQQAGITR